VPDRRADLSSELLYALRVLNDRTGPAVWEPLDLDPVTFDSDAAAQAAGATGWDRPEDIEIGLSTGSSRGGNAILYVAVTESPDLAQDNGLVLKIVLRGDEAYVSNYVEPEVNVAPESDGDATHRILAGGRPGGRPPVVAARRALRRRRDPSRTQRHHGPTDLCSTAQLGILPPRFADPEIARGDQAACPCENREEPWDRPRQQYPE
jgi:hypothetical protein